MAKAVRAALDVHGTKERIMTKFVVALIIVAAVLASGLVFLYRSRRLSLPSKDVLDRVARRNQELDAQERRERED